MFKSITDVADLDFNNDKSKDFAFCSGKQLKILDTDKNIIYDNQFELTITHQPQQFNMPDKSSRTGIVTEDKIYLINSEGKIEDGFPLSGSTTFKISDINNDKTANLIVVNGSTLYTYNLK